jgi:hypothetical protein
LQRRRRSPRRRPRRGQAGRARRPSAAVGPSTTTRSTPSRGCAPPGSLVALAPHSPLWCRVTVLDHKL